MIWLTECIWSSTKTNTVQYLYIGPKCNKFRSIGMAGLISGMIWCALSLVNIEMHKIIISNLEFNIN